MSELDPALLSKIRELSPQDRAELAVFVDFLRFKAFFGNKPGAPTVDAAMARQAAARQMPPPVESALRPEPALAHFRPPPPAAPAPEPVRRNMIAPPPPASAVALAAAATHQAGDEPELILAYGLLAQSCLAEAWGVAEDAGQ